MCLILFSYLQNKEYKLILAANRDEFYERPTAPAAAWHGDNGIIGGKDLRAGGTWMGLHGSGRYGMVTNYRDPAQEQPRSSSRGHLVTNYLKNTETPSRYLSQLDSEKGDYNGYNILLGDADTLWYYSNRSGEAVQVEPGLYGLSNHLLDTPWPKVVRGKALLNSVINGAAPDIEGIFQLLLDNRIAPDDELPQTGVPLEWERTLSSMFIRSDGYGTRCSSILLIRTDGRMEFYERTYPPNGEEPSTVHFAP